MALSGGAGFLLAGVIFFMRGDDASFLLGSRLYVLSDCGHVIVAYVCAL